MGFAISPTESLADESTPYVLSGLLPEKIYECSFSTTDGIGSLWRSQYHLPTNGFGEIHLAQQLDHPLAFLRDMRSDSPYKFEQRGAQPIEIDISLSLDNTPIGTKKTRRIYAHNVEKIDIRNGEIYGYGYYPEKQLTDTAVVLFSGSGGGLGEGRASLYASRGITCFSIPYFKYDGLPETLENIPLDYFPKAINHLRNKYGIKKLVALGTSRGGELVLLLGSLFPDLFQGIIAIVPSSVTYGGMPNLDRPAWIYNGSSLPIAPFPQAETLLKVIDLTKPIAMTPHILEELNRQQKCYAQAEIAVENIPCPIQLISANDDQMWPSTEYCTRIMNRLAAHHKNETCTHFSYNGAGHIIIPPYVPSTSNFAYHPIQKLIFDNGGNPKDHFIALEDAWKQNLSFILSL